MLHQKSTKFLREKVISGGSGAAQGQENAVGGGDVSRIGE